MIKDIIRKRKMIMLKLKKKLVQHSLTESCSKNSTSTSLCEIDCKVRKKFFSSIEKHWRCFMSCNSSQRMMDASLGLLHISKD